MVALTASDEPVGAPQATNLHTRYDVSLVDMGGTPGGFIAVPIAVAGDHLFFFNAQTTLSLTDSSGTVVTPEVTGTSTPECAEVKRWARYDLTVGTYTLELSGPSGAVMVSLVHVIDGGAHAHE